MLLATCFEKVRDSNKIVKIYKIRIYNNGEVIYFTPDELKKSMLYKEIEIDNLRLSSDNRIIDKKINIDNKGNKDNSKANNTKTKLSQAVITHNDIIAASCQKALSFKTNANFNNLEAKARLIDENLSIKVIKHNVIAFETSTQIILATNADRFSIKHAKGMFQHSFFTSIDLNGVDTSELKDASMMFALTKAKKLNLSAMDTHNVTNMSNMFYNTNLESLNISNFDTSNVEDVSSMFCMCRIQSLDLSNFNTSNIRIFNSMFSMAEINDLNIQNFNTDNAVGMYELFYRCKILKVDISHFNMSNVNNLNSMFRDSKIQILNLGNFNVRKDVVNVTNLFNGSKIGKLLITSNSLNRPDIYIDEENIGNFNSIKSLIYQH